MTTMLEKIHYAIDEAMCGLATPQEMERIGKKVLESLKTPDAAMIEAGTDVSWEEWSGCGTEHINVSVPPDAAREVWTAMVSAILAESGK